MIKEIDERVFKERFESSLVYANFNLRSDMKEYFHEIEKWLSGDNKEIVNLFRQNYEIAKSENRSVCQDTGYVQVFINIGRDVHIGFDIEKAINETVEKVYKENFLRMSITDPLTRVNTRTNTPAFIDYELSSGNELKVDIMLKGGGSENATRTGLFLPSINIDDIKSWVIKEISKIGSGACPPYIIGICIGGNLEKAVYTSKKLLLEMTNENNMNKSEELIADELMNMINSLPIGFQGLKFGDTVISVKVKILPTHIASLPVAFSIGCNAIRQAAFVL